MKATPVAKYLFADKVITDEMQQEIQFEKTGYSRNRKLLRIILGRGPRGFHGLKRALLKAQQNDLSKLLNKEDSEPSEYEKKLIMARSFLHNTVEKKQIDVESNKSFVQRQQSHEPRCRINLDNFTNLFLTASPYKEEIMIHIRHFTDSHGRIFPTKKGVTFPLPRWLKFECLLDEIEDYLENHRNQQQQMKWHIGGGVYVSLTPEFPTLDIRHFWKPDDSKEPIPTKKGVTLTRSKFDRLRSAVFELREVVPELNDAQLCMLDESHQNQLGVLICPECTPFGYEAQEEIESMDCDESDQQSQLTVNMDWN
ncbi:uncharacterized protein LOC133199995 [Saccostrea echinata]|uniref:uncharacterized protein LOC133199995 n=1 Tax=Saccostrea echinata TaxID=191078 RepID=UPI002A840077|nr:uncharacterized protein LOC133199995 [Saccostrea echinata]